MAGAVHRVEGRPLAVCHAGLLGLVAGLLGLAGGCSGAPSPSVSEIPGPVLPGDPSSYPEIPSQSDQPLQVAGPDGIAAPIQDWISFISDWPAQRDRTTSFSVYVCLVGDTPSVVIEDVAPVLEVGDGFTAEGAVVRTSDDPLISTPGFPPAGGTVVPAKGAVYSRTCADQAASQQIVLGLTATGPDGGGWIGVDIGYRESNGQRHVARVALAALLCGRATAPCSDASG